ncbi:type VII secretion protein EccB [Nocardioides sp. W7]|uniref:type VII secretion protein EccB n=1 Tax=Nocardioides sp. W7 TaxID=2931390 RepID=UPI001FD624ED|nr:type VII secretion protein EccB [Nocardioides sp. W7]
MATTRDLAEAQGFDRRRLVTAFVSGAHGGHEVDRTRPGRTVVGGLALAVLLVAGALVARLLVGGDPDGWDEPGLLIAEDSGALYVILERSEDPVLHPVPNVTSARLILGHVAPTLLSEDTIAAQELGPELGILGAPQTVPDPDRLVHRGWSACTSVGGGLAVGISAEPGVRPVTDRGLTVVSEGRLFVVATGRAEPGEPRRAYRYSLPDGGVADPLLAALGLPITAAAREVPERWLRLLPSGGALDFASLGPQGYGEPAPDQGPGRLPAGSRIGQVVTTDGQHFQVLTVAGPATLDPFAKAVYEAAVRPSLAEPLSLEPVVLEETPRVRAALPPFVGAHWPVGPLGEVHGEPCALLVAGTDDAPVVLLATDPTEAASAEGLLAPAERVRVEPGHGGHARVDGGSSYLIDARGAAHALVGDAAAQLGYGGVDAPLVPDAWVELFEAGVPLSREGALCPDEQECR